MIKVSVFYPNEEGKKFDWEYYLSKHLPMVKQKFGTANKRQSKVVHGKKMKISEVLRAILD
jgi:uncharacterized protein (TIGR02118 family)